MAVIDIDVPALTLMFLCVVAALASALVWLFCMLEQSAQLTKLRIALIQRVEQRIGRG